MRHKRKSHTSCPTASAFVRRIAPLELLFGRSREEVIFTVCALLHHEILLSFRALHLIPERRGDESSNFIRIRDWNVIPFSAIPFYVTKSLGLYFLDNFNDDTLLFCVLTSLFTFFLPVPEVTTKGLVGWVMEHEPAISNGDAVQVGAIDPMKWQRCLSFLVQFDAELDPVVQVLSFDPASSGTRKFVRRDAILVSEDVLSFRRRHCMDADELAKGSES
mmetsp:Transcript_26054/g.45911  ORF Transcript_26054/g.45911 Transcript_26054/m.45911 type:complete len:219 (-) Transcript_26054:1038-1694(-)